MEKFLINHGDNRETKQAFSDMLSIEDGNRLTLCTGNVGGGYYMPEQQMLLQWLQAKPDRHLTLIFGYWGDYEPYDAKKHAGKDSFQVGGEPMVFVPKDREDKRLMRNANTMLSPKAFPPHLAERILVVGINNFHVKAIRLRRIDRDRKKQVLAGIIGSTNFTNAALTNPFQFEMDLYATTDKGQISPLLEDFSSKLDQLLDAASPFNSNDAVREFDEKTLLPAVKVMNQLALDAYIEDLIWDEIAPAKNPMEEAYGESDKALELRSFDEK